MVCQKAGATVVIWVISPEVILCGWHCKTKLLKFDGVNLKISKSGENMLLF